MITCGVDIGARSIEVVLYDGAQIMEFLIADTGTTPADTAASTLEKVLETAGIERGEISTIVATGYGRNYFEPADRSVSEIICHAKGASYYFPTAGTVIDIGGQDSKLIELGEGGRPVDFVMNDRCAAGTGKFLEFLANVFQIPVEAFGAYALSGNPGVEVSSMCTVFAETEATSLMAKGRDPRDIALGLHASVVRRTANMLRRVGVVGGEAPVVFSGGVAHNPCIVHLLGQALGQPLLVADDPDMTGALGAALWGEGRRE